MKTVLRFPYAQLRKAYHVAFARPSMQGFNNRLLDMALHARGFNNCCDPRTSGEELFIKLLAATNPKLCLDVGANKGQYALLLLKHTQARVISFEPLPKAFAALQRVAANYPQRFEAVNTGLGARKEVRQLHYGCEDSEHASFSSEVSQVAYLVDENVNTMDVPVTTLDSYCEQHLRPREQQLDLLKIDTEGYEYEVLLGARHTIARLRPKFVQLEYNWHQLFRGQSLFQLAGLLPGYRAYQLLPFGGGLSARDPRDPETNVCHYSNFVFARSDIRL